MDPVRFVFLNETGASLRGAGSAAPLAFDGPVTGAVFLACVEQVLAPALSPGGVVVLDNLAAHRIAGVREAIAVASTLHLPPCSPDLNPIKQVFAKLKALLRRRPRPGDALGHHRRVARQLQCGGVPDPPRQLRL